MGWISKKVTEIFRIESYHSVFENEFSPGFSFTGESHDFWECMYVVSGNIRACGDERVYELRAGNAIFHKSREFHKFDVIGNEIAHLLIFSFDFSGNAVGYFENKVFDLSVKQVRIADDILEYLRSRRKKTDVFDNGNSGGIYEYFDIADEDPVFLHGLNAEVTRLFLSLYENGCEYKRKSDRETDIFKNAVDYMRNNVDKKLSLSAIAKECRTSETVLKGTVKKFTGLGVHKYFLQMKLEYALSLIDSGETVTNAASMAGFASQPYFSAVCLREKGVNPSKYKH